LVCGVNRRFGFLSLIVTCAKTDSRTPRGRLDWVQNRLHGILALFGEQLLPAGESDAKGAVR
jgi:hypothetical protein